MTEKTKYLETVDAILNHPATSFWLKDAIRSLEKQDPINASNDVAMLYHVTELRVDDILGCR